MMFNDRVSKAMYSGMDALWMKQKVISNNIANYDTPNYKAKTVDFQEIIDKKMNALGKEEVTYNYVATISTDNNSVMKIDGSNVDIEKEELELWRTYAQYSYLQEKVNGEFKKINSVIGMMGK